MTTSEQNRSGKSRSNNNGNICKLDLRVVATFDRLGAGEKQQQQLESDNQFAVTSERPPPRMLSQNNRTNHQPSNRARSSEESKLVPNESEAEISVNIENQLITNNDSNVITKFQDSSRNKRRQDSKFRQSHITSSASSNSSSRKKVKMHEIGASDVVEYEPHNHHHLLHNNNDLDENGDDATGRSSESFVCAGCSRPIKEQFLLGAVGKCWHEDCLKCACCECRLGEVGSSLYVHLDKIFCRRDYLRIFGPRGNCAVCRKSIEAYELVMKAKDYAYHIECFACQQCQARFCVGDAFCLWDPSKIVCLQCHQTSTTTTPIATTTTTTTESRTEGGQEQMIATTYRTTSTRTISPHSNSVEIAQSPSVERQQHFALVNSR